MESLAEGLGAFGGTLFRWAAVAFVLLNGAAVMAVVLTRSRSLVNRWTPRLIIANLALLGIGAGVPAVAYAMKLVVSTATVSQTTEIRLNDK